ncbi:MAG: 30S ribosomal protein S14 [Candidatus Diapherotrites archaeon]|nr:30S ribosomal protein S14 [Candidatus Diapherotrites archaeon]
MTGKGTKQEKKRKRDKRECTRCGANDAVMSRYNLNLCRRCFKEVAPMLGFKKND